MLARALEIEREEFLGRVHYQRGAELRGYRNGYAPERTVGTGMGAVAIRQPRVSDVPTGAEPFASEIVGRYERRSETQARLLARLYLEGLASGDFEPVFRELVGATAGLSPNSILRLKQEWADEDQLWRCRPLTERYVYVFADGLYLKAGLEAEKTAMLIVIGVTADGRKDLLAMEEVKSVILRGYSSTLVRAISCRLTLYSAVGCSARWGTRVSGHRRGPGNSCLRWRAGRAAT
jgi:transposase-like protein